MTGSIPDKMKVPGAQWEGLKRVEIDRAEVVHRAALPLTVLKDDTQISTAQFSYYGAPELPVAMI